jgi:hypothetical protein
MRQAHSLAPLCYASKSLTQARATFEVSIRPERHVITWRHAHGDAPREFACVVYAASSGGGVIPLNQFNHGRRILQPGSAPGC